MRTIVLAENLKMAHQWCVTHGVPPSGRSVCLVGGPVTWRGMRVEQGDRIVWVGDVAGRTDFVDMLNAMPPAGVTLERLDRAEVFGDPTSAHEVRTRPADAAL